MDRRYSKAHEFFWFFTAAFQTKDTHSVYWFPAIRSISPTKDMVVSRDGFGQYTRAAGSAWRGDLLLWTHPRITRLMRGDILFLDKRGDRGLFESCKYMHIWRSCFCIGSFWCFDQGDYVECFGWRECNLDFIPNQLLRAYTQVLIKRCEITSHCFSSCLLHVYNIIISKPPVQYCPLSACFIMFYEAQREEIEIGKIMNNRLDPRLWLKHTTRDVSKFYRDLTTREKVEIETPKYHLTLTSPHLTW